MKNKPIIIVAGEPKSVFFEIFFKSLKKRFKSPIILIACKKLLDLEMTSCRIKKEVKLIKFKNIKNSKLNNKYINLINIEYLKSNSLIKFDNDSSNYIKRCFEVAFKIIKSGFTNKFINGPINKTKFLNKKYPGMTEYISLKFNKKKFVMLIFNKKLSVCPVTTHLPLKMVSKNINKKAIIEKIKIIDRFYVKNFKFKPNFAVTGLNPHCESTLKSNEDIKIVEPAIKTANKLGYNVFGPFAADTIFQKSNRKKFNVILGMYHDQVLTPVKTLFEYDAINITLGLPFFRVTPDHGPNVRMHGKNRSNPLSLIKALEFLDSK